MDRNTHSCLKSYKKGEFNKKVLCFQDMKVKKTERNKINKKTTYSHNILTVFVGWLNNIKTNK